MNEDIIGGGLLSRWIIFGENPTTGLVDVADSERDVFNGVTREQAEALIAARDTFVEAVLRIMRPEWFADRKVSP